MKYLFVIPSVTTFTVQAKTPAAASHGLQRVLAQHGSNVFGTVFRLSVPGGRCALADREVEILDENGNTVGWLDHQRIPGFRTHVSPKETSRG